MFYLQNTLFLRKDPGASISKCVHGVLHTQLESISKIVSQSIQFFGGCSPEGFPQSLKLSRRPFRKILRNKSPTSWGFLASCGATNLHSMTRGYSFMSGGVCEHVLARLRASYCTRIHILRGWVRIVPSFSGAGDVSGVSFCDRLA